MKTSIRTALVVLVAILGSSFATSSEAAIIRVKTDGDDANSGSTWALAKRTVQGGIAAAVEGDEVWVAAGTYVENITLADGVALYGGFAGTEAVGTQRNWEANECILDGNQQGSVVTVPTGATTVIDGFTIRNGTGTVDKWGYSRGGGIYCWRDSSAAISNNTITGNSVNEVGGGICSDAWCSRPSISSNTIAGNSAGFGGGIACIQASASIFNNTITGNSATHDGGGIYCDLWCDYVTISNNTITGNSANCAGGIYCTFQSFLVAANDPYALNNNIVAFNSSGITAVLDATLRNNCVYNPGGWDYWGTPPGEGDISEDPLFEDRSQGNYHLRLESPCIEAGDNSFVEWSVDLDGAPRVQGARVDMGCYEFPVEGTAAHCWAELNAPEVVRPGREYILWLHCGNTGGADLPAPVFIVSSPSGAPMRLTKDEAFHTSPIQVLGISYEGDAGLLKPREMNSIPIYFQGIAEQNIQFHLEVMTEADPPIDWEAVEQQIRPPDADPEVWDPMFAALQAQIGDSWEDYANVLRANADRLALRGQRVYDARELFGMEVEKAYGNGVSAISGKLVNAETEEDLPDVQVVARSTDGTNIGETTTDAAGQFSIDGLHEGTYELFVEGYYFLEPVEVSLVDDRDVLGLVLQAYPIPEDPEPPAVVLADTSPLLTRDASGNVQLVWRRGAGIWHAVFDGVDWNLTGQVATAQEGQVESISSHQALLPGYPEACLVVWRDDGYNDSELVYSIGRPDVGGGGRLDRT